MTKLSSLTIIGLACLLSLTAVPTCAAADTNQAIPQGVGSAVLNNTNYFGNLDPNTQVTIDIVMKLQNKSSLAQFINQTTDPNSRNFHQYLSVKDIARQYAPSDAQVLAIVAYLKAFGIQSTVYPDHLIITASGTAGQFNRAFSIVLKEAKYHGKRIHATPKAPKAPSNIANNILCVLGLSNYSDFHSNAIKRVENGDISTPTGPLNLTPQDLVKHYNVQPLYDKGATGLGQTIGIVTLADFNEQDAYEFWNQMGINIKPSRITKINVDGGSDWNGYDETSLDVEQSGALAPQANIRVYVAPNSDTGFVDGFAKAINENQSQQISVSWGQSETVINYFVQQQLETPEYAEVFNQLYMQAAAQGISMFAAAGDEGAYDAVRDFGLSSGIAGTTSLSVDNPADSPYITAAGGTTLPFHFHSSTTGLDVSNDAERAWGWDYLWHYFDARGLNDPNDWASHYLVGGGGGFSQFFATPDYQIGVPGVNRYTGVKQFSPNADASSLTRDAQPTLVKGTGQGRNLPDLSMNADPYTGYLVYFSDPGAPGTNAGFATYGGTSFVAPQLCGLSALINSSYQTRVGFWNPQIYRFALQKNSPFTPLDTTGSTNDNGFYTGRTGTVYNQATGLGIPDIAKLANAFAVSRNHH